MMEEKKLIQYIQGRMTSESEMTEIVDWIEASEANREKYNTLKNLWVITGLEHAGEKKSRKFFPTRTRQTTIRLKSMGPLVRYAAVFVLAFISGAFFLYLTSQNQRTQLFNTYNEIQVPNGEKSIITLYDGTKVWLNSGTTFRYPVAFRNNERKVFVDGEAYFDVAKKKEQPFIVQADQLQVKVLGTRFNICAYHQNKKFYVTLEEGSVHTRSNVNGNELVLSPGEQATFSRNTNHLIQTKVDTELYSSWKEDLLRFEDAAFKDVIKKMERWYGVDITLDGSINTEETYTMTIKTESLREMLNLLSKTTPMKYEINGNNVFITKP